MQSNMLRKFVWGAGIVCALGAAVYIARSAGDAGAAAGEAARSAYVILNESSFDRETAGRLVFADFFANRCDPCVDFDEIFAAVAAEVREGFFAKVDVDASPQISSKFGIQFIPYIVAVRGGSVLAQFQGERTAKGFAAWCREQISKYGAARN